MGLRYRKSINLGGGFRVNFSKSGVGYSWGTKGYRVTKKAGGGVRKTYSIPGTGLSWVDEGGRKRNTNVGRNNVMRQPTSSQNYVQDSQNVLYQSQEANVKELVTDSSQEFIDAIKKYTRIRGWLKWGTIISFCLAFSMIAFEIIFVVLLVGFIYFSVAKKITVEYEFDEYGTQRIRKMDQAMQRLSDNRGVWQVNTIQANSSRKTHAGASQSVGKKPVRFQKKTPYFLKTDATCYYIKLLQDQVFILPDRLIVKGKKGWGVVEYSELHVNVGNVIFIENGAVPKDAEIVGYTWQFVNKNGSPDKRYKNNRQLPKCNYGDISFKSDTGLNVIIYISNIQNAKQFASNVKDMIEDAKQARISAEQEMRQIPPAPVKQYAENEEFQKSQREISDTMKSIQNKVMMTKVTHFNEFVLTDASSQERTILETFWNELVENKLDTVCQCRRLKDGTIEIQYKGTHIGSMNFRSGNSWISYPLGNSGKAKQVEGTTEELSKKVSNWLRYIMNYL